jgi:hypothetical protein
LKQWRRRLRQLLSVPEAIAAFFFYAADGFSAGDTTSTSTGEGVSKGQPLRKT